MVPGFPRSRSIPGPRGMILDQGATLTMPTSAVPRRSVTAASTTISMSSTGGHPAESSGSWADTQPGSAATIPVAPSPVRFEQHGHQRFGTSGRRGGTPQAKSGIARPITRPVPVSIAVVVFGPSLRVMAVVRWPERVFGRSEIGPHSMSRRSRQKLASRWRIDSGDTNY